MWCEAITKEKCQLLLRGIVPKGLKNQMEYALDYEHENCRKDVVKFYRLLKKLAIQRQQVLGAPTFRSPHSTNVVVVPGPGNHPRPVGGRFGFKQNGETYRGQNRTTFGTQYMPNRPHNWNKGIRGNWRDKELSDKIDKGNQNRTIDRPKISKVKRVTRVNRTNGDRNRTSREGNKTQQLRYIGGKEDEKIIEK